MADKAISALPAASAVNDADLLVIVQGGTTKRAAASLVQAAALAAKLDKAGKPSDVPGYRLQKVRVIVSAVGSNPGYETNQSNGTDTTQTSRVMFKTPATSGATNLEAYFFNGSVIPTTAGPNAITVKASIVIAGTKYPVFFGGQLSVVLQPGTGVHHDPVDIDVPANTEVYYDTNVAVTSGQKWPANRVASNNNNEGFTTGSDLTAVGSAAPASAGGYVFGPSYLRGTPTVARPVICAIGDSIGFGSNSSSFGYYNYYYHTVGIFGGAFGTDYPMLFNSIPGKRTDSFFPNRQGWGQALQGCTHAIVQTGRNDLGAGLTLAQMQANDLKLWFLLASYGMKVWQTTTTPQTNSTDGYATVANQTVANATQETRRVSRNDWFRDGTPISSTTFAAVAVGTSTNVLRAGDVGHPLTGYYEVTDSVESGRNSGKWKAGYTNDGLHGNDASYPFMSAAIDKSILTL